MSKTYNDRIQFLKSGIQKKFILDVEERLGLNRSELAKKLTINKRTLYEWTKENITISKKTAEDMSRLSNIPIPSGHTVIDGRVRYQIAGREGARVKFEKYNRVCDDEEYRSKKWREWWEKIGKYKKYPKGFQTIEKIKIPEKSKLLAEFIGILLGDGHIATYQVTVALSSEEKQYIAYVCKLIRKLFGVTPSVTKQKQKRAVTIVVSRKLLVEFCEEFGFKRGNKITNQVDIPDWIKKNKEFSIACVRGLLDTDGCFFNHQYVVNGKKYSYLKIAFTSASVPLRQSVAEILINNGFNVRMSCARKNSNGRDVRIDDEKYVRKYIEEIGSHNNKHIDKIKKWKVALNGKAAVC